MYSIKLKRFPTAVCVSRESLIELARVFAKQHPEIFRAPESASVDFDHEYDSWFFCFLFNTENKTEIRAFFDKYDEAGEFDPDDEINSAGYMELPDCMSRAILKDMSLVDYSIEEFAWGENGDLFLLPGGCEYKV